jgi:AbrB family looped-hinge helix DNA binding protein
VSFSHPTLLILLEETGYRVTNNTPFQEYFTIKILSKKGEKYMESLGLVRKLDDYKRVPIPKEVKEILNLKKGDSVEFFKCDEGVIIRKHNPSLKE